MSTDINQITINEESEDYIGGLLKRGDSIDGYVIKDKISTSSGEAEIYYCEKDSKTYILKYYFNKTIFSDLEEKLKSLNHKNVMKVYACGKDKKRGKSGNNKRYSYEIDEFCQGESLANSKLPLREEEAFEFLKQINEGLNEIHKAGIIHRDIKAENIYYKNSEKKEVVIGDFGISVVYDQKDNVNARFTEKENIPGTDGYKAPDVYDHVITPAIDYYSLGITLWHLLTGKIPFIDDNGQPMSSDRISYDTINEKVKDFLLSRAPELSAKAKKVISGLLVCKHDQRWGYNQLKDFLAGKEVAVFEERKELPAFYFCNKELFSLKAIAEEMLKNREEGIKLLEGTELTRYLDNNDFGQTITPKIEKIKVEYFNFTKSAVGIEELQKQRDFGLVRAAFVLYNNLTFYIKYHQEVYEINTTVDFEKLLLNHPKAILPYLKNERLGLYLKLDAIANENHLESFSSTIRAIVEKSKNESILPYSCYLAITENKITPFKDKLYSDIELRTQEEYFDLPENLKERLMYLVDAKDKMLTAWFEKVFKVNMADWYDELEGGPEGDKLISHRRRCRLLAFGKWQYFELFLKGKDVIYRNVYYKDGKCGLLNFDGSILLEAQFDDVSRTFIRNSFSYKKDGLWYLVVKKKNGKYEQQGIPSDIEIKVNNEAIPSYAANIIHSYYYDYSVKARLTKNPELEYICSEVNHPNERYIYYKNGKFYLYSSEQKKNGNIGSLSFSNIQNISAEGSIPEELTFWVCNNNQVVLINKDAKVLETYPYTDFEYAGNNCFIVTKKDGSKSLVSHKNEVIRESVDEYISAGRISSLLGGNFTAIKKADSSRWEIVHLSKPQEKKTSIESKHKYKYIGKIGNTVYAFNSGLKINFFTEIDNEVQTTSLLALGKGGLLINSKGQKKRLEVVNHKDLVKAVKADKPVKNVLVFDGKSFLYYDFEAMALKEQDLRNLLIADYEGLMDFVNRHKIVQLVKKYIAKQEYEKANKVIDSTYSYYMNKNLLKEAIFLLTSIRMDKMQGLRFGYLRYVKELGYLYERECQEPNKRLHSVRKCSQYNLNYIKTLLCKLSAAGREINNEGKIITRPGFEENKKALGFGVENLLSCAEFCIDITQLENEILLPYSWTNSTLVTFAQELLAEAEYLCLNDTAEMTQAYHLNYTGGLYLRLGKTEKALAVYEKGMAYDEPMLHVNTIDWLRLLYKDCQYEKAIAAYRTIQNEKTKKEIEAAIPDFVKYYNKHMQEYRR